MLEYTSDLLMYIDNADVHQTSTPQFFSSGNDNTPSGVTKFTISEKAILVLNDEEKRGVLLKAIHDSLVYCAHTNGQSIELLQTAYHLSSRSDFYYDSYKPVKTSDERFVAQIQTKENWGTADHRLLIEDLLNKKKFYYPIVTTSYPFFDEMTHITDENKWDIILKTPQIFDPREWIGSRFIMFWGNEKYVFDLETEKVSKEAGNF